MSRPDRQDAVRAIVAEFHARQLRGEAVSEQQVLAAHPELAAELAEAFLRHRQTKAIDEPTQVGQSLFAAPPLNFAEFAETQTRVVRESEPAFQIPGYRLIRELSRGGQGVVFQGLQESTNRKVAIKVLRHGPLASEQEEARFVREAQVLAALRHPNIVCVFDCGRAPEGAFYLVMEYVSGQPLDRWLNEYFQRHPEGPPPSNPAEMLRLFMKIADAVNAAHLRGIVHRDLKPSNIHIDQQGEPHILDFGLAHIAAESITGSPQGQPMTMTGQFLGSLPWASPEQAEGAPSKIDCRTDVYSLGVVLYQMLTGQFPYEVVGNMRDVLDNIMRAEPSPPSQVIDSIIAKKLHRQRRRRRSNQVNTVIDAIVLKSLSKNRADRYQNAGELARDVGNYLSGRPTLAGGEPPAETSWRRLATIAAGLLLAAALGALATRQGGFLKEFGGRPIASEQATGEQAASKQAGSAQPTDSAPAADSLGAVATDSATDLPPTPDDVPEQNADDRRAASATGATTSPAAATNNESEPSADAAAASAPKRPPPPESWTLELDRSAAAAPEPLSVSALAWSSDGRSLAISGRRGGEPSVGVVDLVGMSDTRWIKQRSVPRDVRFGRSSRVLAWTTGSRDAILWNLQGSPLSLETSYSASAKAVGVAWSPDGGTLATASSDGLVRLWSAAAGAMRTSASVAPRLSAFDWAGERSLIVVAGSERALDLFDANVAALGKIPLETGGLADLALHPREPLVALCPAGEATVAWHDLQTKTVAATVELPAPALHCRWSPAGDRLAVVCPADEPAQGQRVVVVDRQSRAVLWQTLVPSAEPSGGARFAWSPSGESLAIASPRSDVAFYAAAAGRPLAALEHLGASPALFAANGHYRAGRAAQAAIRYQFDDAQSTSVRLSAAEFAERYSFQNASERVQLDAPQ